MIHALKVFLFSTLSIITIVQFTSCSCDDEGPAPITSTAFQFVNDNGQPCYGTNGLFQFEEICVLDDNGANKIPVPEQTPREQDEGIYTWEFNSLALTNSGETYVVQHPDLATNTITVFYEAEVFGNGNCSSSFNKLVRVVVDGNDVSFQDGNVVVVTK